MTETEFLQTMNYTKPVHPSELPAVKRVMIIKELGFTVTHETIDLELNITRRHAIEQATALEALPEAEQVTAEVEWDNRWLDSASVAEMDAEWEAHCKEVADTRATDYPM